MKIFAVTTNYPQHNKPTVAALSVQEEPTFFLKPDTALLNRHKPFFIPDDLGTIDGKAEVVVRISRLGKGVPMRFAHRYYDAVTVGVGFTARQLLERLSAQGQPWDMAKSFDCSAALGDWVPLGQLPDTQQLHFRLDINGAMVQQGFTADMLHPVDELIAAISQTITLRTGDILYTGAPLGTGPTDVRIDDHLEGYLEGHKVLDFNCK